MKKVCLFTAAFCSLFFLSCTNKSGGLSDKAKKNLDAMHGITQCFDSKDFSKLGDYIAEDGVDHSGPQGDIKGLANMKKEFAQMVATFDGSKTEVVKELADDEYVMTWQHYTGTSKVDQNGMKAGAKIDMTAIEVAKFKDGKAVEHWTFMQPADMMKMMGSMPPPPMDGSNPAPPAPKPDDTLSAKPKK